MPRVKKASKAENIVSDQSSSVAENKQAFFSPESKGKEKLSHSEQEEQANEPGFTAQNLLTLILLAGLSSTPVENSGKPQRQNNYLTKSRQETSPKQQKPRKQPKIRSGLR